MPDEEESRSERLNRELIELLNELRVALPGVQVLFAFLLTIPFSRGFGRLSDTDRSVYFAGLLATVLSTALLIAPSAYHRLLFRHHDKEGLIEISNRLALVGIGLLAAAISCSLFVIGDVLYGTEAALAVSIASAAVFGLFWYLLPLSRRLRRELS